MCVSVWARYGKWLRDVMFYAVFRGIFFFERSLHPYGCVCLIIPPNLFSLFSGLHLTFQSHRCPLT